MIDPSWKPFLSALVQPPASLLLLIVFAVWLIRRQPRAGTWLIVASVIGAWLMGCIGTAHWLQTAVLRPPEALNQTQIRTLTRAPGEPSTAIVVLGGGRQQNAPEYASSSLTQQAMARLRYGVWLARRTNQPLAYAGGIGWAQAGTEHTEAETAARIVQSEYGTSVRWLDSTSRDTRENAENIVPTLVQAGVRRIVLVTHAAHLPRALRAFRQAAGKDVEIVPAPMGFVTHDEHAVLEWMPSPSGYWTVLTAVHEVLGLMAGA